MNVALYPRVSTQEQAQEGYSIGEQTERLESYCKALGWNVYNVYTDAGFSGANMNRPGLQKLIKDVKAGRVDKVVVYKLDRLSRSQKDTLTLIEDVFLANGVDFVSMSENFDTSTPLGKAMIGVLAVFAQLEREQIKERLSMGRDARAKSGKFHGSGRIPIGYDYIDGELVTNEFEKIQVIKIFEMFNSGVTPFNIAKYLNEHGYTAKDARQWYPASVRRIIRSRLYLGYICFSKQWYPGTHEAFIDEATFNAAQIIDKANRLEHDELNRRKTLARSYLGGMVYCGRCGDKYNKRIRRHKHKDGHMIIDSVYICHSRNKRTQERVADPNCDNRIWKLKDLDSVVFAEIRKLAVDPAYYDQIRTSTTPDETPVIQAQIDKIDAQVSRLIDLYSNALIPSDVVQKKIAELTEQKKKLNDQLDEAEAHTPKDEILEIARSFSDVLDSGDFDEIRLLLTTLIRKVVVDGDDVTIYWNFT